MLRNGSHRFYIVFSDISFYTGHQFPFQSIFFKWFFTCSFNFIDTNYTMSHIPYIILPTLMPLKIFVKPFQCFLYLLTFLYHIIYFIIIYSNYRLTCLTLLCSHLNFCFISCLSFLLIFFNLLRSFRRLYTLKVLQIIYTNVGLFFYTLSPTPSFFTS